MIIKLHRHPPAIIIYSNLLKLFTKKSQGLTLGPIIFINKELIEELGLLYHELQHVNQYYESFGLFPILYLFRKYRLQYELEAYTMSIIHSGKKDKTKLIESYSEILSSDLYNLNITKKTAEKLLMLKWMNNIKNTQDKIHNK